MVDTTQNYIRASLVPACLRVLHSGVILWLILGLCFGIAALLDIKGPLIHSIKYGLIVFSVYQVLNGFLVEATRPERLGRPLLALPPSLARHSYQSVHVILLYSAISITIIGILGSFEPRTKEILWRVYTIGVLGLFIWFVAPKHMFLTLLFPPQTKLRKFQRGCIHTVHPLSIAFFIFLIVLNSLGYVTMAYELIGTMISSIVTIIAVAVARKLITAFILDRAARKKPVEERETSFKVTRAIINYSSVIVSIIVILGLWVATFVDFSRTPTAPAPLKGFASRADYFFEVAADVLGYRLGLGGGAYTTPLNIIIGLAIIAAFFLVAAAIKRLLERKLLAKVGVERGTGATISSIVTYVIVALSILFALSIAGVPLRSLAFFAGALGIGIGFGMQNIVNNFLSGIIMLFERPIRVGDVIILSPELGGTVERIGPRSSTIVTPDDVTITVPNAKLMDSQIVNWSQPRNTIRVHLSVGVAYGSDTELVKKCLLEVAGKHRLVWKHPEPIVRFDNFGDSALMFELLYWTDGFYQRWISMSELRFEIDKIFRENNITIAFPQRDIHIKTITSEFPIKTLKPKGAGQKSKEKKEPS